MKYRNNKDSEILKTNSGMGKHYLNKKNVYAKEEFYMDCVQLLRF